MVDQAVASVEFNGWQSAVSAAAVDHWLVLTHGGDDSIILENLQSFTVHAGLGNDQLVIQGSEQSLDLATSTGIRLLGTETIDLRGSGHNSLHLTEEAVLLLANNEPDAPRLLVRFDEDDELHYGTGWAVGSPEFTAGETLHVLT